MERIVLAFTAGHPSTGAYPSNGHHPGLHRIGNDLNTYSAAKCTARHALITSTNINNVE